MKALSTAGQPDAAMQGLEALPYHCYGRGLGAEVFFDGGVCGGTPGSDDIAFDGLCGGMLETEFIEFGGTSAPPHSKMMRSAARLHRDDDVAVPWSSMSQVGCLLTSKRKTYVAVGADATCI